MTIALLQTADRGSESENLMDVLEKIRDAGREGAKIAVLPELCLHPYLTRRRTEDERFWMGEDTLILDPLQKAAQDWGMVVVMGVAWKLFGHHYNGALVIDENGQLQGCVPMAHRLPGGPYDGREIEAGSGEFKVFSTGAGPLGVLVGDDLMYCESPRILALHGAQLIVALGVPWALSYDAMLAQMKAYACQNGVYVAYVNRAGEEADFVFGGGSALIDPEGYVTAQAAGAPQSLYGRIHPERSHQVRTRLPFLDNRKCQGYLPLIQNLVREA